MKKFFSILLVAAMLVCMAPAMSLFADEMDLSIDSADELIALATAANAGGDDYAAGKTFTVSTDLDMTGKTWTPFTKKVRFAIDFDGHTLSNLKLTVENGEGNVGLIANILSNGGGNGLITNLKMKDCELTVTGSKSANVGIVGYADRANVTNIEIDGLKITHEGAGSVGVLMGNKAWGYDSAINATMKNVTVDAPYANVGVVCGKIEGSDKFKLDSLNAAVTVKRSLNDVDNNTLVVTGGDKLTVAEGITCTVTDQQEGKRTNYTSIGSADDLIALAEAYNKFGRNFLGSQEVKITADIDMTGKAWTPIKDATFTLNGQNHTITGLSVTVDSTEKGDYGLLVNVLANNPGNGRIKDLTIKDSIITVNSTATELSTQYAGNKGVNVGAVVGRTDRGALNNVNLTNVTVKVTGKAMVGGLAGLREWQVGDDKITGTLTNVLIDAPDATAGVISGYSYQVDGTVEGFTATVAASEGTTLTGEDGKALLNGATGDAYAKTEGENVTVTVSAATADSGYVPPKAPDTTPVPETKPAETGDFMIVAIMAAIIALAGAAVVSKKRATH